MARPRRHSSFCRWSRLSSSISPMPPRLAFSSAKAGPAPLLSRDGLNAFHDRHGANRDADMEPDRVIRIADITARDRERLLRCPRDSNADQIGAGDEPIGWIELNPACPRQVDAAPGMCAATTPGRSRSIVVKISRDETCG